MFKKLITNWQTSVVGVGLLIVAVGHSLQTGGVDVNGFIAALTGMGLIGSGDAAKAAA